MYYYFCEQYCVLFTMPPRNISRGNVEVALGYTWKLANPGGAILRSTTVPKKPSIFLAKKTNPDSTTFRCLVITAVGVRDRHEMWRLTWHKLARCSLLWTTSIYIYIYGWHTAGDGSLRLRPVSIIIVTAVVHYGSSDKNHLQQCYCCSKESVLYVASFLYNNLSPHT